MSTPLSLDAASALAADRAAAGRAAAGQFVAGRTWGGVLALFATALVCLVFTRPDTRAAWWTVWVALLLGQLAAQVHWAWRGAAFAAGLRPWNLLGGVALGVWGLLLFEPAQRFSQRLAFDLAQGTPWWGVASGLAWCLLLGSVPLVGLAAYLAWRALAHAVLAGRVSASLPHDVMWVGCIAGLAAAVQAAWAPLGWGRALELGGSAWATAAQRLSLFVDEYGAAHIVLFAVYVAVQFALSRPVRGGAPPLVIFDLRRWTDASPRETRALQAFACAWGEARGGCVLVREDAHALKAAGQHVRWAHAAGRVAELFASGPGAPRRWCATWLAPNSGPFVREALLDAAADLREMALAAQSHATGAYCLLIAGSWAEPAEVEALRLAWPKQRALVLVDNDLQTPPIARLATVTGELGSWQQRRRLVQAIEQRMQAPGPSESVAVIGRPRRDRLCDQLAALLDQRLIDQGRLRLDVQRPARESAARFDRVVLLVDAEWLAGEAEAGVEATGLQPLLESTSRLAVFAVGTETLRPTRAGLRAALLRCGWKGAFSYHGLLSEDPQQWPSQGGVERFVNGATVELSEGGARAAIGVLAADDTRRFARDVVTAALAQRFESEGVVFQPGPDSLLRLLVPVLSPRQTEAWNHGREDELSRRLHRELDHGVACLPVLIGGARFEPGATSLPLVAVLGAIYSLSLNSDAATPDFAPLFMAAHQALAGRTPVPAPATPQAVAEATSVASEPLPLPLALPRLQDCQYSAYLSFAQADDAACSGWVTTFGRELETGLRSRLRGVRLPLMLRDSSSGPVSGPVGDELRLRMAASFALILFVHDHYIESAWCEKELETFVSLFGEVGVRERLYIAAMSQAAIVRLTSTAAWARLMPREQPLWIPFYADDAPDRPVSIYKDNDRQIVDSWVWERLVRIREDLAKKMRAGGPMATEAPVVRLHVESGDAETVERWEPLFEGLQRAWQAVVGASLQGGEALPVLRPRLSSSAFVDRPDALDDVDAVLLLWGRGTPDALVTQIGRIESRLAGPDGVPAAVVRLVAPHPPEVDALALSWPVLRFDAGTPERIEVMDEDRQALDNFLHKVFERHQRGRTSV
jgi:hypothetical protein